MFSVITLKLGIDTFGLGFVAAAVITSVYGLYLVYKYTDKLSMQNHFELIEYIKQNYTKVEEILYFDVYKK